MSPGSPALAQCSRPFRPSLASGRGKDGCIASPSGSACVFRARCDRMLASVQWLGLSTTAGQRVWLTRKSTSARTASGICDASQSARVARRGRCGSSIASPGGGVAATVSCLKLPACGNLDPESAHISAQVVCNG
jgi:hypothetical protein